VNISSFAYNSERHESVSEISQQSKILYFVIIGAQCDNTKSFDQDLEKRNGYGWFKYSLGKNEMIALDGDRCVCDTWNDYA